MAAEGTLVFASRGPYVEAYDAAPPDRLLVVDATDPGALLPAGSLELPGGSLAGVAVAPPHLLAGTGVHSNDGGLVVFDAADPEEPRAVGALPLGQRVDTLTVAGRYALAATGERVFAVDFGRSARPACRRKRPGLSRPRPGRGRRSRPCAERPRRGA